MVTVYLISDSHFGHANILTFAREDGSLLRPGFADVDAMNEHMVERWNSVVRPQDHVYHVGDFAIPRQAIVFATRLNGHKRLVRGNHDIHKTKLYIDAGFTEIHGVRVLDRFVLSHVPLHPLSLRRDWINIHGHHHNNYGDTPFNPEYGKRYFNVSAEIVNYTPITLEEVKADIARRPEYHAN